MDRAAAFKELKSLTIEATTILGDKRAALVAGCSPSTLRPWLLQPVCLIHASTIRHVLPRLRHWHIWLPGYLAEKSEIRRLEARAMLNGNQAILSELVERLAAAQERFTLDYLVTGCEVPDRLLMQCLVSGPPPQSELQVIQALEDLRHLGSWPQPLLARKQEPAEPA